MQTKRLATLALTGTMALSLATTAFASSNTTTVNGSYKAATISVTVQPNAVAFINPYGLDLEVPNDGSDESNGKTTISGQQIVCAPIALKNESAMDLTVNATVTTTIGDVAEGEIAMKLATATTKGVGTNPEAEGYVAPATGKSAFVYLEAKPSTLSGATVSDTQIATEFAAWAPSTFDAAKNPVLSTTRAVTQNDLVTLRAATMSSGTFASYNAGSIALIRLAGDCVTAPKNEWKTADTFTASIAYTFAPADITKYGITVNPVDIDADAGSTTVTATPNVNTAAQDDTVTITLSGVANGDTVSITVTDANGGNVDVTVNGTTDATFTMPGSAVTVDVSIT